MSARPNPRHTAPYPFRMLGAVALGTALVAVALSLQFLTGVVGPFDLRDVILAARQTLPAFALPLGWLGVWAAGVHGADSVVVGAAPGRSRSQIVLRQSVGLAAAVGAGWLLGWATSVGVAVATQYWTPVDLLAMLTLAVSGASLAGMAVAVAMLMGVRMGASLVPVALLGVMLLPAFWINDHVLAGLPASTQALSYVWSVPAPARGQQLFAGTELVRLMFFLLVTFTVARAAAGWAEFRATRRQDAFGSTAWLAFPLVTWVAVSLLMPVLYVADPNDQPICRDDAGYTLCLYRIDEPRRAEVEGTLAPMLALLPRSEVAELTFSQDWDTADAIGFGRLGGNRSEWLNNQLNSLLRNVFLPPVTAELRCAGSPEETQQLTYALEQTLVQQVASRGAAAAGDDAELRAAYDAIAQEGGRSEEVANAYLSRLSDEQFGAWYQQNRSRLAGCSLTEADFT